MKICPNCGKELADDVKFCEKCGFSIESIDKNEAASNMGDIGAQDVITTKLQPQMQPNFNHNQYVAYDPKDHTSEYDARDIADNKLFAAVAYMGMLGIAIALLVNNSPFTRFHAKNGAALLVCEIIACVVFIVPLLGWVAAPILLVVLEIVRVVGFINVLKGKALELPLVSDIGFISK
ncbi:MAG: zinc-ribbon domain-containing protein [Butyrivibrio sp.]|nr:zinc-ribbon domain-containing protein [Butyrivibrio sp.]